MGEYLQLSPPELKFRFELRKNIPVTLSLHNPGDESVAFKVKTTAPKKYCVRPSSGVVEPKATKDIQVARATDKTNRHLLLAAVFPAFRGQPELLGSPRQRLVQVIMQAQRENPTSFTDCKDKFLVQSCIVSNDIKDVSGDVFEKAGDVKQTKLRVVLMSPPKPPSPVPEGIEEESSPANGDRDDDAAGTGRLRCIGAGVFLTGLVAAVLHDCQTLLSCFQ